MERNNKRILGLDLGSNSIGWALIQQNFKEKIGEIIGLGSRIIPMSQDVLGDFGKGNSVSQTAERTGFRSIRRLRERHLLRRERLHRVLNILGFLPKHYAEKIDFSKRLGQFLEGEEPKLAYDNRQFIFQNSFQEMLADFRKYQPELFYIKSNGEETKIPYDWTIYYLRKKALDRAISKEELAWIILNFNQKRGYYQLRGEEEIENPNKKEEFYTLKIVDVVADEESNKKGEIWYSLHLENGWVYRRSSKIPLYDWKDKVKEFIVTTEINDDGSVKINKDGEEKRSFRAPKEDDWTLLKKKTEHDITLSETTVGAYIYDNLLKNPSQKIKGKLVRTIERKFYKEELEVILRKQIELQPELFSDKLLNDCISDLYKNNEAHQKLLKSKDFVHLFINDIIFYQRPLKSQKSLISECELEFKEYKDKNTEEKKKQFLKVIPKSNPYYQEFRVLQWLYNLKIYTQEEDKDVSAEFINSVQDKEALFEFLMSQKEVDNQSVLEYLLMKKLKQEFPDAKEKALKTELKKRLPKYRWNYVYDFEKKESKKYPMNETGAEIRKRLEKVKGFYNELITKGLEYTLWHLIYSVTDKEEYESKALPKFAQRYHLDIESFVENFKNFKPFKSEYGGFSEKAIKKLLPLMRFGKYWNYDDISNSTQKRIQDIINGEENESIKLSIREKAEKHNLRNEIDFQGLPLWLAQYVVYNKHSEAGEVVKWTSVQDLENYLQKFRQHSLRNPIVEQIVMEALRVVKDIWQHYGNGEKEFFDEIHIELGRELKKTAKERKEISDKNTENENANQRIKALLIELKNQNVENVRPYSPMQQEILKIYEEGVLNSDIEIEDDIMKISKKSEPTPSELIRYKCWLEQKYKSPYTGQIIPLSRLFTADYEIEHIIPQSRYFDDSFSNKVICESAVNKLKDNQLGLEFIKKHYGQKVTIGSKVVEIFSEAEYRDFVKKNYAKNRAKLTKLLLEEIPEKMIERQLNDTRYISKYVSQILSNIVRADKDDEGVNSKNLIPCTGKITTALRQDWGLNDVWNDLILSRFERMNTLTETENFTSKNKNGKLIPAIPFEYSKGFQKKRLDHRHHALDALVIACATREHINFINNQNALEKGKTKEEKQESRIDLRTILCDKKFNENSTKDYSWVFKKTWETLTQDAKNALENVVVSFKQNLRVINKATNYYEKYVEENGKLIKKKVKQEGVNWSIRKPLHKDTVSGKITLDRVNVAKNKILTATRKSLDATFNEKNIFSITDTGIQQILLNYLKYKGSPELAFSPEGLEEMNKNIAQFNNGKNHKPIYKVRVFEEGSKFPLGENGTKSTKYVEAAKGTNLFFGIYVDEKGVRSYATIPLNEVIERQKQGLSSCPETDEKGNKLLFSLSPNDLVYVPTEDENVEFIDYKNLTKEQKKRLYNVNDFTSSTCYFVLNTMSKAIFPKEADLKLNKGKLSGSYDTKTASFEGKQIKDICIKLKIDRLGNISKF